MAVVVRRGSGWLSAPRVRRRIFLLSGSGSLFSIFLFCFVISVVVFCFVILETGGGGGCSSFGAAGGGAAVLVSVVWVWCVGAPVLVPPELAWCLDLIFVLDMLWL
jgi:hypothetical protein